MFCHLKETWKTLVAVKKIQLGNDKGEHGMVRKGETDKERVQQEVYKKSFLESLRIENR